ncbi:hypothetical protein [Streptomyces sp. NPDC101455]|uniref:hypothetical protein n=1 Tax=Streptomyces sp. NPDC101455 TaxID=3366142 RepID=UPI0038180298
MDVRNAKGQTVHRNPDDPYAFCNALNREAARILIAAGHEPARPDGALGFELGLLPELSPEEARVLVMIPPAWPQLTDEEVRLADEDVPAYNRAVDEHVRCRRERETRLIEACMTTLGNAGWATSLAAGSIEAVPPPGVLYAMV